MERLEGGSPPRVRPMTVLRAFFVAAPCISRTISSGKFASNTKLWSTGDGPWRSTLDGAINPGPLLGCVDRAGLLGLSFEGTGLLPECCLSFRSCLLSRDSLLAGFLSATATRASELVYFPATIKKDSGKHEGGKEFNVKT